MSKPSHSQPVPSPARHRRLRDLAGVGPRVMEGLEDLGIGSVDQLGKQNPQDLYDRLSALRGERMDPCVLDTFTCAIAQANDPLLPADQRNWWYWSRVRKGQIPKPPVRKRSAASGS